MALLSSPNIQTIHLSSAGRAAVRAQLLAPEPRLAATIDDWVDRLVASAPLLDISPNTYDARTLLPAPIEELETVLAKSRPDELRGYRAMERGTAQVLDQWCAVGGALVADLSAVLWRPRTSADRCIASEHRFPATLPLARYQRMALCAAMQVASDTLVTLASVLWLAREPHAALFSSSLSPGEIAQCDATSASLASLFAWGHQWGGRQPTDRRRDMVLEHWRDADLGLTLLFEGTHEQERRQILARLLIDLSILKRRV
jgi:hypothetical protein